MDRWRCYQSIEPSPRHGGQNLHEDRVQLHGLWRQWDDFLLLPGDGLLLISGAGSLIFFDNRARKLLGKAAQQAIGQPVEAFWPELSTLLEQHSLGVEHSGPLDTLVEHGGLDHQVRLFRSENGMGVVLLSDRTSITGVAGQQ